MNIPVRVELEQGSLEWYEHRRRYRNASETAAVMELSPWVSPLMLYEQKIGASAYADNAAMQHGRANEAAALRAFNSMNAEHCFQPAVFVLGDYSASLDGLNIDGQTLVEIKCPVKGKQSGLWQEIAEGNIPLHYRVQIEQQLRCSGASTAYLWVWDANSQSGMRSEAILPDNLLWQKIQTAWDSFAKNLATQTPPKAGKLDVVERTDLDWQAAAGMYASAEASAKFAEKELLLAKKRLLSLCTHTKEQGAGITVTQFWRQGNVDYKAIPELKNIDVEKYRGKPVKQTRITVA